MKKKFASIVKVSYEAKKKKSTLPMFSLSCR